MKIVYIYMFVVSLISVILCVLDKICAIRGWRRIRESTLLSLSFIGGSLAMYLVMRIIHHKTRHTKFMLGLPLMIVLQIVAVVVIKIIL